MISRSKLNLITLFISHKKIKILFLFIFLSLNYFNMYSQCKPMIKSFKSGEILEYSIVYNWGFIWVNAGKVKFEAKKELLNNKEVYHFSGTGTSVKKYDWIFTVRDYYNSWAHINSLKPIKYSRNTSEGKQKTKNYYSFDYNKNKIYSDTWNTKKKKQIDTLDLQNCTFDIMTAVYYARTLDFSKYKLNEKIPLTMIVDNEIYNLYGRFLGKDVIKTRKKEKYNCLKFSILLVEGTMFKGGEDLTVWVSDDKNRIPLLVEAKILVGSVKAVFNNAKNLKYPSKYKIPKSKKK